MSSTLLELTPEQLSSTPTRLPPNGIHSDAEINDRPMSVVSSVFFAISFCFSANRIYLGPYNWNSIKGSCLAPFETKT